MTTDPLRTNLLALARAGEGVRPSDPAFIRARGQGRRTKRRATAGASIAAVFIAGAAVGSFMLPKADAPAPATPSHLVSATPASPSSMSPEPSVDTMTSPTATSSPPATTAPSAATTPPNHPPQLSDNNVAAPADLVDPVVTMEVTSTETQWPLHKAVSKCMRTPAELRPVEALAIHYQNVVSEDGFGSGLALRFASVEDATAARTMIQNWYETCDGATPNPDYVHPIQLASIGEPTVGFFGSAGWLDPRNEGMGFFEDGGVVQVGDRVAWATFTFLGQDNNCSPLGDDPDQEQCHVAAKLGDIAARLAR